MAQLVAQRFCNAKVAGSSPATGSCTKERGEFMAPQRSTSMDRMWNDFRKTFPDSIRAQDGWIGDLAHSQGKSGHNPDDTPGVQAEREDADSKQEVRGIDKDKRLNAANGTTLEQVVQKMLKTPNDLKRLIYIIFNRRIWKKSNGWKQETYTGSDPHDMHAHFSGDPVFDEDGAEWTSITSFGAAMTDTTPAEINNWTGLRRLESVHKNLPTMVDDATTSPEPNGLHVKLEEILTMATQTHAAVLALAMNGIDTEALAEDIANKVIAADTNPLTEADKPIITAAVKDAFRQGTE